MMKTKSKCECDNCKLSAEIKKVKEYLLSTNADDNVAGLIEKLHGLYIHEQIDHDVLKAKVDNNWASAELHMESLGWVRKDKEILDKYKIEIKRELFEGEWSFVAKTELYQGLVDYADTYEFALELIIDSIETTQKVLNNKESTCKYCSGMGYVEVDVGQLYECERCM